MDVMTSTRQARMIRRLALATLLLAGISATAPVDANAQVRIESKGVRMGVSNSPGQIYFGGHLETAPLMDNLSFRIRSRTNILGARQTDLVGGFSFLVGMAHRDGLFSELKVGAMDNPGLKFAVGYTFN